MLSILFRTGYMNARQSFGRFDMMHDIISTNAERDAAISLGSPVPPHAAAPTRKCAWRRTRGTAAAVISAQGFYS